MNKSTLRKYYLAFCNLYGAINSENALLIMKQYKETITKAELEKDLEDRWLKNTTGYGVVKTTQSGYIIALPFYFNGPQCSNLHKLFANQEAKMPYLPENKEEFLKFSDYDYIEPDVHTDKMRKFLTSILKDIGVVATQLFCMFSKPNEPFWKFNDAMNELCPYLLNDHLLEFLKYYLEYTNNIRRADNIGFTPHEMSTMSYEFNNISFVDITFNEDCFVYARNKGIKIEQIKTVIEKTDLEEDTKKALIQKLELTDKREKQFVV
jgi:hypothetical protein